MTSDHDNRWRTGGSYTEVKEEAQIDPVGVMEQVRHFAEKRNGRLRLLGHPG